MTKKLETFNRSDLEEQLLLEFPQLDKEKISIAIDIIINTITEAVALDNKVEIRGFGTFSKNILDPENLLILRQKQFHI